MTYFEQAVACSPTAGSANSTALGAYGWRSPKIFPYEAPGQASGVMLRTQSISGAYPEYKGQTSLLNIIVYCAPAVRAFPQNVTMTAPEGPNEAYTFSLSFFWVLS